MPDKTKAIYQNKTKATLGDMFYFFDSAEEYNNRKYVLKAEGMSLISDTTLTAITNHLAEVEGSGGGDSTVPAYDFNAALDEYFANKTATLNGGGA